MNGEQSVIMLGAIPSYGRLFCFGNRFSLKGG